MKKIKLRLGDIHADYALPCSVYDDTGTLLLRKGHIFESHKQLTTFLNRGVYRDIDEVADQSKKTSKQVADVTNPFDRIYGFMQRLEHIFRDIEQTRSVVEGNIIKLCGELNTLCDEEPDAALASVHLCHDMPYTVHHPVHQAILNALVAKRLNLTEEQIEALLAASLTANIGMNKLQLLLQSQSTPLTDEQKKEIQDHPIMSVQMLKAAGISNSRWLLIVAQHHEKIDGGGYPSGEEVDLLRETLILTMADTYSAMVSSRTYRGGLLAKEALREFFLKHRGKDIPEEMILIFIKELSIFPPGTFVRLQNGETAVVIKRATENSLSPEVNSFLGPRGTPFFKPFRRDCSSAKEYEIKEMCLYEHKAAINLPWLWGYIK